MVLFTGFRIRSFSHSCFGFKPLLLVILFLLVFPLFADSLPEERPAPLFGSSGPAVRYWNTQGSLPVQTVPGMPSKVVVPKQADPKLLVMLYHNLVFGRTGNAYNRDLYNFEHDLAYLQRTTTIIDFNIVLKKEFTQTDQSIITFDDGDLSLYAIAFPLLKQYGIPATIFLVPNFIGEVGYMSWDQIREMASYRTVDGRQLIHFGSHSLTHRPLSTLTAEEVRKELTESKRIIELQIGQTVTVLALPFGDGADDPEILRIARQAEYKIIRTSQSKATKVDQLNLFSIPAFNVENYSTDQFSQRAHTLLGR